MIISASKRTDIPAFYSDWFFNRLNEGFVDVRNPRFPEKISRVSLSPDVVDCIVFWTKNPQPMLDKLHLLDKYSYYFQFTVNAYDKSTERNLPDKDGVIIPAFKALSDLIGTKRVIWRYDPIFISEDCDVNFHKKSFENLADKLAGYTEKCVISFLDVYGMNRNRIEKAGIRSPEQDEIAELAAFISNTAAKYGLSVESCAEKIDLSEYGISHGHCIDKALIEEICGYRLEPDQGKPSREDCGCYKNVDIGAYNTCRHNCIYCYANNSVLSLQKHDQTSSLISGNLNKGDIVSVSSGKSLKVSPTLF